MEQTSIRLELARHGLPCKSGRCQEQWWTEPLERVLEGAVAEASLLIEETHLSASDVTSFYGELLHEYVPNFTLWLQKHFVGLDQRNVIDLSAHPWLMLGNWPVEGDTRWAAMLPWFHRSYIVDA